MRLHLYSSEEAKAGKFWVYEQAIRIPFYAIYEVEKFAVEVFELIGNRYQKCESNLIFSQSQARSNAEQISYLRSVSAK